MKGPRLKKIRRLGTPLPGLTRKEPRRGAEHPRGRRHRPSAYRVRLEEKQKVRWHYGVSEGQLRTIFGQAERQPGDTGVNLLTLLERRLDSVVFRVGFAPTIRAARQLVAHGHVQVNGARVDRAGYRISAGEEIAITLRGRTIPDVAAAVSRGPEIRLPAWLRLDAEDPYRAEAVGLPAREEVPFLVSETAIVEFYAR